jgi:hypothetical protein
LASYIEVGGVCSVFLYLKKIIKNVEKQKKKLRLVVHLDNGLQHGAP